jgi:hypothetical protein
VAGPLTATARIQIIARDAVGNAAADASDAAFSLVDGTPPAFTLGPTATPHEADAAIEWQTDELATGCVRWGLTRSFGDSTEAAAPSLVQAVNLNGLTPEMTYYYCVVVRDTAGNVAVTAPDSFTTLASTVAAGPAPPHTLALSNPYPIPAHGHVSLVLDLPQRSTVDFAVYDVRGRRVWSSARRSREPGRWLLEWQGLDDRGARVPAGVYLACVTANGRLLSRRITLLSGGR